MSVDDLDSLEETLDILRDPDLVESIRVSREEAAAEGLRHLDRLPEKVRHAAIETILGVIADNPSARARRWSANWLV